MMIQKIKMFVNAYLFLFTYFNDNAGPSISIDLLKSF